MSERLEFGAGEAVAKAPEHRSGTIIAEPTKEPEKKPKKRAAARVFTAPNADHIHRFIDDHDLTRAQLGDILGVSESAVHSWCAINTKVKPPKWTLVAIEGLRRRMGSKGGKLIEPAPRIYWVRVPDSFSNRDLALVEKLGLKFTPIDLPK